ncbi:MAG: hypothetical protein ACYCTE_13055, partial [Acidimicrobiales bacterium]
MTMSQAKGQRGWLHWWLDVWIRLQHPPVLFFTYLIAGVDTLIAAALISGFARRTTYASGAVLGFLIWSTIEGFDRPLTAGSTVVGASFIYVVAFVGILGLISFAKPVRCSVDCYLERRTSWWWRAAGMGRPIPARPTLTQTSELSQ